MPTLTSYAGIVSDIPFGIIYCNIILSGIRPDILSDTLSGIYSDKLSGTYFDIFSGI